MAPSNNEIDCNSGKSSKKKKAMASSTAVKSKRKRKNRSLSVSISTLQNTDPQEKISCSLVLKLKVFYFRVFTGHTRRCITRAALFFKNVPGTFFNATHQVKAIAIGVSEANPLVEIG